MDLGSKKAEVFLDQNSIRLLKSTPSLWSEIRAIDTREKGKKEGEGEKKFSSKFKGTQKRNREREM